MGSSVDARRGFAMVEVLVGLAIFAVIAVYSYQAIIVAVNTANVSRARLAAAALANEQMEIAHNLSYGSVGTVGGWPAGVLAPLRSVVRDGKAFTLKTTVRNIDDAFDGQVGGSPNDTSPADYKLVEVLVSCPTCRNFSPLRFDTWVAPTSLEATSSNGSIFIRAFDASGMPLPGATVHVVSSVVSPAIDLTDVTDASGVYRLIDVPPGANAYAVTVSKDGYSTERTYSTTEVANPVRPPLTVTTGTLTQASFSLDTVGSLAVNSISSACAAAGNVAFTLNGAKTVATSPTVYKYARSLVTGGSGTLGLSGLEWDAYAPLVTSSTYDLLGTLPVTPLSLNPGEAGSLTLVVGAKSPRRLMVTVTDATTKQPLTAATARLYSPSLGYDVSLVTGRGYVTQTDWVGGSGQESFTDATRYFSQDNHVKVSTSGQMTLAGSGFGRYYTSGELVSSTFDLGTAAAFQQVVWSPTNQPSPVGANGVRVQVATNNDATTWDFVGPDGTSSTYYTTTNQTLWSGHSGNRYLRYKVYLQSANSRYTPTLSDVSFSFTTGCVPPGQVSFPGLAAGTYALTVSADGYTAKSSNVTIPTSAAWQRADVTLSP